MQVSGADAWPRPAIVDPLVEGLLHGQSYSLFGLRRIGKSSVMAAARERMAQTAIVLHADAQNFATLPALFDDFLRSLPAASVGQNLHRALAGHLGIAESILRRFRSAFGGTPEDGEQADEATFLAYWGPIARLIGTQLAAARKPV